MQNVAHGDDVLPSEITASHHCFAGQIAVFAGFEASCCPSSK
jgi:hypothetical protein